MSINKKVLIVAAHPDDEVLGCGGTIARMAKEGYKVFSLILGEGITSRDDKRDSRRRVKDLENLRQQAMKANDILGVKRVFFFDYPDNRFDSVPLIEIVKTIEKVKSEIKPGIIFTHHENDLNIDHRITYRAVLTASRPLQAESANEIYSYEVLSSTEWSYPLSFSPDVFFDISDTIDIKLKALREYKNEIRKYPHPRSLKGARILSESWGMKTGIKNAEAFKAVRIVRK